MIERWYVVTPDGAEMGPYEDFSKAYWAGVTYFGQGGFGIVRQMETSDTWTETK